MATAPAFSGASTSKVWMVYQWSVFTASLKSVVLPAFRYEVVLDPGCPLTLVDEAVP